MSSHGPTLRSLTRIAFKLNAQRGVASHRRREMITSSFPPKKQDGQAQQRLDHDRGGRPGCSMPVPEHAQPPAVGSVPGDPDAPLFTLQSGAFTRTRVLQLLNARLRRLAIPPGRYSGHSFRKGAAQHAADQHPTKEMKKS